jgi:hypothetical protein
VEALRRAKPPLRIATGASTQAEIIASRLLPTRLFHDLANRKLKLPRS